MLDGSRSLAQEHQETVGEVAKVLQLRQQVEAFQEGLNAKLTVLAETTRDCASTVKTCKVQPSSSPLRCVLRM